MKKLRALASVIVGFITMPIWYYLLYQILVRVEATQLMFFLFWVYVPFSLFATIVSLYFIGDKK